jgi:hypothetical protein
MHTAGRRMQVIDPALQESHSTGAGSSSYRDRNSGELEPISPQLPKNSERCQVFLAPAIDPCWLTATGFCHVGRAGIPDSSTNEAHLLSV